MAMHLIKLCVGVSEVGELEEWVRKRRPIVQTRMTPKKADEILGGGSLYWVVKGLILVRHPIIRIETIADGKRTRCEIELAKKAVLTQPAPRRAFQGWRYLPEGDAPPDLPVGGDEAVPTELAAQLRTLGAW
jgi:hypothetical protein